MAIFFFIGVRGTQFRLAHSPKNTMKLFGALSSRETHVRHLQIRMVSQGVVCVHSVYLSRL
jgi:hypothetical protein